MPIPAVVYCAKSTEDKRGSIPDQLADCRAMAEREGWGVVGEFSEEDVSAWKGDRGPKLVAAMELAEREAPSVLVVQHSDRLARGDALQARHLVEVVLWGMKAGVTIRSVEDDLYADKRIALLMGATMGQRNTEDSKRKSEATKAGKRRRAERGDSTGPLAFGYKLVPRVDGEGKQRVPDRDEARVVRRVFKMAAEGNSVGTIMRWLNDRDARTKRGNAFDRLAVRRMLSNPYYAGKVTANGEVLDGNHEGLVSWAAFQRVQQKLEQRPAVSRGGRPPVEPSLLTGVMRCAHCGKGVWQSKGGGENRTMQYVCGNVRHATGLCDAARFDAATVEAAVLEHLDSLFVDLGSWIERMTAERDAGRGVLVKRATALNDQRAQLQEDEDAVRADYRRQLRSGDEDAAKVAASEVARIEAERAELDGQFAALEAQMAEWDDERDPADRALDWWSEFSAAIRREVVNSKTVREANRALRDRFAAIFVTSPQGGSVRLDFVLKDRDPDAPLVAANLWAHTDEERERAQERGEFLVEFMGDPTLEIPAHSHA